MIRKIFLRGAVLLGAMALLLPACSKRAGGRADIVFINGAEVGSIDPVQVSSQTDGRVTTALFEGLMRWNEQGKPEPGCAEEPTVSPDGKTYTFKIRETAKWSNGEAVTAQQFVETWERFLNPASTADYASAHFMIVGAQDYNEGKITDFSTVGVKALDERTLEVKLLNPTPYFRDLCAFMAYVPIHVAQWKLDKTGYFKPGKLVNNGPYILQEWRLNDRIRLVKNPHYWDRENVKSATVDVLPIDNPQTAFNLFLTGEADLITDKGLVPASIAEQVQGKPWFHRKPILGTWFLRFNCSGKRKPFDDPRVRRAMSMVIDRERIVKSVTRFGEVATSTFTPIGTGQDYTPPAGLQRDIAAAQKLLEEAGFPGGKGFPTVRFLYPSKYAVERSISIELQNMWKQHLGLNVALEQQEYKVFMDNQKKQDYDISRSSWVGDYNDPMTFLDVFLGNSGNNRTGWANEDFDRLLTEAAAEVDIAKRNALFVQAEKMLVEEHCAIAPVYHYVGMQFYRDEDIGGVSGNLVDEHPLRTVYRKKPH